MRKIAVLTFVTLDGVMQAPGGPDEVGKPCTVESEEVPRGDPRE